MKKLLTSLITVLFALSSLSAFSWSGLVDNNSKFTAADEFKQLGLNQSNGVYLSVSHNLNETGTIRFTAEGLYKYNLDCNFKSGDAKFKNIVDLDLLKISDDMVIGNGALSLSAGRFRFTDFSGSVFSQTSDGAFVNYSNSKLKASLYAGYTGLLNRLNVSMVENKSSDSDNFYALCPKYVPVLADFSYKKLFDTNTVGFQAAAFIPVSDENTMKAYGTLIANGYLGTKFSYDAKITLGTVKFENLMMDAKADVNYYLGTSAMVTGGVEYVSGEQGGIKPFETISARAFGGAPLYNGVIVPKLGIMYASGKLYAKLTERFLIEIPNDSAKFNGFDTTANVTYRLFSDVVIGGDVGAYICTSSKALSSYYATIKASLVF